MATQAVAPAYSVDNFKVLQNSIAFAASKPLVELSQHCNGELASKASAIDTRFRLSREQTADHISVPFPYRPRPCTTTSTTHSPPETPRTNSFPTFVLIV
jgi:hypothetical protein